MEEAPAAAVPGYRWGPRGQEDKAFTSGHTLSRLFSWEQNNNPEAGMVAQAEEDRSLSSRPACFELCFRPVRASERDSSR